MAATVIQFPGKAPEHSEAYGEFIKLISMVEFPRHCWQIKRLLEECEAALQPKEYEELQEKVMHLRDDLVGQSLQKENPGRAAQIVDGPGVYMYNPEMGDPEPVGCQMVAYMAHYGNHWYVETPLVLKGRGIQFRQQYTENSFACKDDKRVGWYEYYVTERAFNLLKKQYSICQKCYLD